MFRLISLLLVVVILQACGNKGPLFLPKTPAAQPDNSQQAPQR